MHKFRVHLAIFGANLIYGANYGIAKEVMPEPLTPFAIIIARVSIAGLLFWLLHISIVKEKVAKEDWGRIIACAVFGVAANQMLFFKGLSLTSPINASVIMVSTPILVLLAASIIIRERVTWFKAIGVALGATGAFLLIGGLNFQFTADHVLGDLMILANATSYGIYLVLVKPLMNKYHVLTIVRWVFFFGFFMVLPFGWQEAMAVDWAGLPSWAWLSLGFIVIFTTFFAYLLNAWGLRYVSPSVVGAYIYLQPVLATIFAYYFSQASLTWEKAGCSLLIFIGVYLVNQKRAVVKKMRA